MRYVNRTFRLAAAALVLALAVLQPGSVGSAPPSEDRTIVGLPGISQAAAIAVTDAYFSVLCREPDPDGLSYWASRSTRMRGGA
jgi:hypothetical protein